MCGEVAITTSASNLLPVASVMTLCMTVSLPERQDFTLILYFFSKGSMMTLSKDGLSAE